MLILLLASCFSTPAPASGLTDIRNSYYPYTVDKTDLHVDGFEDRFTEIHLPCDEKFVQLETSYGTGYPGYRQLTSEKTSFNLTGTHTPHRYKVYTLAYEPELVAEVVEHRCSIDLNQTAPALSSN